jgi:hypothetical protein
MAKQGMSSSGPSLYPQICSQIKLTPAQSTQTNKGTLLFLPADGESAFVTPSILIICLLFGGMTNVMALEDSMWDINMVSDAAGKVESKFWLLTNLLILYNCSPFMKLDMVSW